MTSRRRTRFSARVEYPVRFGCQWSRTYAIVCKRSVSVLQDMPLNIPPLCSELDLQGSPSMVWLTGIPTTSKVQSELYCPKNEILDKIYALWIGVTWMPSWGAVLTFISLRWAIYYNHWIFSPRTFGPRSNARVFYKLLVLNLSEVWFRCILLQTLDLPGAELASVLSQVCLGRPQAENVFHQPHVPVLPMKRLIHVCVQSQCRNYRTVLRDLFPN